MPCIRLRLNISPEAYVVHYEGVARTVSVQGEDGRRYEFPAEHLRRHVMHDGVHGIFELCFDEKNKFVSLNKI